MEQAGLTAGGRLHLGSGIVYEPPMRACSLLGPLLLGSSFACGLVGCTEKPARIEVKGPADSLRAAHGVRTLPVFEEKNATIKLRASAFDDQDRYMRAAEVRWSSRDPSVASVNQVGVVTILSSGETEIVARTTETDPPLESSLPVKAVIIDGIRITAPERTAGSLPQLPLGEHLQLEAEVTNDRGEVIPDAEVRWESTTWAATIGVGGEAEGRAIGKTTIIATARNGATDAMEIEVTDWPKDRRRRR